MFDALRQAGSARRLRRHLAPYAARIASLRRVMTALDFEIDVFAGLARVRLVRDPGYTPTCQA
jgi:hypothetical protein